MSATAQSSASAAAAPIYDRIVVGVDPPAGVGEGLRSLRRRAEPRSLAPFRWAAIHAVELYLNAYLLDRGRRAPEVRGLQHDLRRRVELAVSAGLKLKKRTVRDLHAISTSREYLTLRYEPRLPLSACQPNGLEATLADVAKKGAEAVKARGREPRPLMQERHR